MSNTSVGCSKHPQNSPESWIPMASTEEVNTNFDLLPLERCEPTNLLKPTWRSLFAFTTRKHWFPLALAILFAIISSLLKPASAILFGKLFSTLVKYGAGKIDLQDALKEVSWWCIALTALGFVAWLADGMHFSQWMRFGELQAKSVREQMFAGLLEKNMEWYDLREDGIDALVVRIQTQIRELQIGVSQPFGLLIFEISCTAASLVVGLFFSWKLTLVLLAALPVAALALWVVSRNLGSAIEAQKRNQTIASKHTNTAVTSINTVKVFNGQDEEIWQYYVTIEEATRCYLIQARANASQSGILKLFVVGVFVLGFRYGFHLVKQGLEPGNVVTTFYACLTALQAIEIVLPQWLVLTKGMSAGSTLKSILTEIKDDGHREKSSGSLEPSSCSGDIEVNGISFAYPSNPSQMVIKDATFFFPAGETSFVVGRSGSGKSSLSNLLLRYYEPHTGEILLEGHPINELATDWVRNNITLVQQQSFLFNESILQNIAFGKNSPSTEAEIWEAARTADLEKTLSELVDGLDTVVGSNGKSLSGGQQQRIAIARARLRDSPIVILDEATSALDQRSREKVNNLIRKWRKGRTTIIITHHVSQILDDEYVYVMENGAVVQEGYRKKLAEKKHGTFASFIPVEKEDFSQFRRRRLSEPVAPAPALGSPDEVHSHAWKRISNIFGHDTSQLASDTFAGLPKNRLSLRVGSAQTTALRPKGIWSSPRMSGIGANSRFTSLRAPLKELKSHHISMQPIATLQPTSNERCLPKMDVTSPPPAYTNTPTGLRRIHSNSSIAIDSAFDSAPDAPTSRAPSPPPSIPEIVGNVEKKPRKPTTLKEILGSVWPTLLWTQKMILVLGFFAAFIAGASTPVFAYFFALLLRVYYTSENQAREALYYSLIMLGIAIVDGISTFTYHYCFEYCGQAWVDALRVEAFKRVLAQPKSWFDEKNNSSGLLNEVLDRNAEEMRNILGRFVGAVSVAFWMLTISVIWAFTISWSLTFVTLSSAPIIYAATRLFNGVSHKWEEKCNASADKAGIIFTETFANIRMVRALTLERLFNTRHSKAASDTYKTGKRRAIYSGLLFGLSDSMSHFIAALLFYYATLQFSKANLTVEEVLQVMQLLMFGITNASSVVYFVPQINVARTTATQMLRLARLPLESHETTGYRRLMTPFPISMNNLSFTYASRPNNKILSDINLVIQPGTCTAIVGPSGSGKSTIASILLGLYPPSPSSSQSHLPALSFNGVSAEHCSMASLRTFMSIVPQHPTLFPSTILSNISYGLPEDHPLATVHYAMKAARDAGIHDFIMSLDQGYYTLIGDGGMGISGGQAQRIAIARALIRRPKLLVLDEATSALDAITAEAIRKMVVNLLEDNHSEMAVVTISHGVEMMKIADEVVMIEGGSIVERGKFEELRRRGGRFSNLIGETGFEWEEKRSHTGSRAKHTWRKGSL